MVEEAENNQNETLDKVVQKFLAALLRGEEPDLDEFAKQHPALEKQIRQKVQNCQRVSSLFDSLREVDESEFQHAKDEIDLIGTRLGAFEITEVIGRGGMGVIYKGHDTRLDRVVAIKALPGHLLEDGTARTRFRREATLLASMNHTNIGVLYDIIEQNDGAGYLVLEYVPGETLAERITRGAIKVQEAISIALQIAEAVSAAHEEGVIHRDLKPSNIKITPDGRVKVLDFGLAKTTVSKNATAEPKVTQAGRVIGTPAYMSPEQARAQPVDHRSDIWSFGCVLYEMLTGHLPFEGETATDTLARIIEREPVWDLLPQATPSNIRVLLWRCLAKDSHRRLQHMGDVVLELDETLNVPPDKPSVTEPSVKVASRLMWWLGILCGVAGIVIVLIAASIFLSKPTGPSRSTVAAVSTRRTVIRLPENQTLALSRPNPLGLATMPAVALSPDGSRLIYVADVGDTTQLFLRLMDEFEAKPIAGTERAFSPIFSPDGQSVCFFTKDKLKKVSLLGGEPIIICDASTPSTLDCWVQFSQFYSGIGCSELPVYAYLVFISQTLPSCNSCC